MRRVLLASAGVVLWIVALSGCGGGDSTPPPPPVTDGASAEMPPGEPSAEMPAEPGPAPAADDAAAMDPGMAESPSPDAGVDDAAVTDLDGMAPEGPSAEMASDAPDGPPDGLEAPAAMPGDAEGMMPEGAMTSPDGMPGLEGDPESGAMSGQQAAKPLTLVEKAAVAFHRGRDQDAIAFLYAHGVTAEADEAKQSLDQMGWIGPLKRPAMTVRWGIAIEYVPLPVQSYNGPIFPIGTAQKLPAKKPPGQMPGGQPMPGVGDMAGMGDMAGGQTGLGGRGDKLHPQLQELTGELGARVIAMLQERIARGDFGQAMGTLAAAAVPGTGAPRRDLGGPEGGDVGGGMEGMDIGMPPEGPAAPGGGFGGFGQPQGIQPTRAGPLAPGIIYLGVVPAKDLRQKAQESGVDVVCVFDIDVTAIHRQELLKNETKIRVHDCLQPKRLFETKPLNNIQVQIERVERKSNQDPVDQQLESLFKFVDDNWRLGPLPAGLQADHVLNRLRVLLEESHENPLPVLAEARMYQTRGLLQDAHYLAACQKLLGEADGTQLVNGTSEEKLEIVARWLPNDP